MAHAQGFLDIVNGAKTRVSEVDIEGYRRMQAAGEELTLVDVREDAEWAAGYAAPAIHLGKGIIERDIERVVPDRSAKLVLYCGGGFRSALAGDAIQKMGYTNVLSLAGGWKAWVEAGMPVKQP